MNPYNFLVILSLHIISFFSLNKLNKKSIILNFILLLLYGIGITGGYHRLYTHKSYDAHYIIRYILLLFGTGAFQNSLIEWGSAHRMHHRYENIDKNLDPYSIKKYCNEKCDFICNKLHMITNFIWAHIGWVLYEQTTEFNEVQKEVINEMKLNEWKNDIELIVFQQKYYYVIMLFVTFLIPIFTSKYILEDSWISSVGSTTLRVIILWHCTFFINSLAHVLGERLNKKYTAANNHICSILTFGEGYHNYHHENPKDFYASKDLKCINVTAWLLYGLKKVGLVYNTNHSE